MNGIVLIEFVHFNSLFFPADINFSGNFHFYPRRAATKILSLKRENKTNG